MCSSDILALKLTAAANSCRIGLKCSPAGLNLAKGTEAGLAP